MVEDPFTQGLATVPVIPGVPCVMFGVPWLIPGDEPVGEVVVVAPGVVVGVVLLGVVVLGVVCIVPGAVCVPL